MKKILSIIILITIGITQIYSQCYQCDNTTASGEQATSIGMSTTASGNNSFAGGNSSNANGENSFAFGNSSTINGDGSIGLGTEVNTQQDRSIAIGSYLTSNATNSYVFGQYLNATGSNSLTFGMGTSSFAPLVNNKSNSIMFGVTNKSSLTIAKYGNSDRGYIGIGTDDPQEMAHVVGKLLIERTEQTASSLQFKHPGRNAQVPVYYWDIYSDTYGLKFNTVLQNSGASTQAMIIGSGGSVGIGSGITTPQAKLHVENNILGEGNITTLDKFRLAPAANSTSQYWEISRTNTGLNFAYMDNTLRNVLFMSNSGHVGIKTSNPQAILHLHDPQVLLPQKGVEDSTGTDRSIAKILQITNGNNSGEGFTIHRDASYGPATLFFKQHDLIPLIIEGPSGGLSIAPDGKIGIGTYNPQAKLDVNGSFKAASATIAGTLLANELRAPSAKVSGLICAEEIRVQLSGNECWPDYVFSKDYKLLPLHDVEEYITENQHLPNIPSSAEVESNGVELGAINALLLQKVEELTLYIIQMEKRVAELESKKGGE